MSTPPVPPPPGPNDPQQGGTGNADGSTNQPPRYGENAPQYGQNAPQYGQNAPQYGQNAPQYGQNAPEYGENAPQYGQNPPPAPGYGQQPGGPAPYGQDAPQYGQNAPQYGQSPSAQYPSEQPGGGKGQVPQLVNVSFWLLLAAGAIFVISLLLGLGDLDNPMFRQEFERQLEGSGNQVSYNDIKGIIAGTMVVLGIIGAALYLLVAVFVRKGKNWARILGTVFAALSVPGLFAGLTIGTLGTLLGIAAIVLLYLPATAPYFRPQPFANPYGGGMGNPFGR